MCRRVRSSIGPARMILSIATPSGCARKPFRRPNSTLSKHESKKRSTLRLTKRKRRRCLIRRIRSSVSTPTRRSFRRCGSGRESSRQSTNTSVRRAGVRTMSEVTYPEAIREGLFEEMERDPNVFCLGEDIGAYGGAFKVTEGLMAKFGEQRVIDTPISEAAIIGAAAGAAHMGMRPVAEMQFLDFISTGYDKLPNHVANQRVLAILPCPMRSEERRVGKE